MLGLTGSITGHFRTHVHTYFKYTKTHSHYVSKKGVFSNSNSNSKLDMPKSKSKVVKEKETCTSVSQGTLNVSSPIVNNLSKNSIFIHIVAKPGAKNNNILGIDEQGISVQIAAPPVDGEANAELLKFFSKVLGVRKSQIQLEKGNRSRMKVLAVQNDGALSVEDILDKIQSQISK